MAGNDRRKKQTVWLCVLLAALLLGSSGCSDKQEETADTQAAVVITEPTETQTAPPVQTETPAATKTAVLRYWDVELPENIDWTEYVTGENYRVEFSMMLDGERVMLYDIHIGDTATETVLGTFLSDGISRSVGVNTYSLSTQVMLSGEEMTAEFSDGMDTLEDVIQAMEQNRNFNRKNLE